MKAALIDNGSLEPAAHRNLRRLAAAVGERAGMRVEAVSWKHSDRIPAISDKIQLLHNKFTAIVEQDGPWHIAYCAEVPGANGQGKSREECLANLREAIRLVLEYRREESLRALPPDAKQELVVIG